MSLTVAAAVFPLIFLGELPDKTMFASLVLSSRGRPFSVWVGAASAFAVHVAIAVSAGVAIFTLLPHRFVLALVAAGFAGGGLYSFLIRNKTEESEGLAGNAERSWLRSAATAAGVIFLAEWGDLTQILTANLAARYHAPIAVGVASILALWLVAALAVAAGRGVLHFLPARLLRVGTAVVLGALALYEAALAAGI